MKIHSRLWSHPGVRVGNELTAGERIADATVNAMGSWPFVIAQTALVTAWIALNLVAWIQHFDPYPFILLNLAFSTQAAYAAPLVLISQRRSDQQSGERAESDSSINRQTLEAVIEIRNVFKGNDVQAT